MQQRIQFAVASDGVRIAYSAVGEGPPLLVCPAWISHIEAELAFDRMARFYEALGHGGRRKLVRYDVRGTGLSDRAVTDLSCAARARDVAAVVDHLGLADVTLFAASMGGPPALVYAATHPERVGRLVLFGTFARSLGRYAKLSRALVDLIRAEWSLGSRTIVDLIDAEADKATSDTVTTFLRAAASADTAATILEESLFTVDVRDHLARVTAPVLVLHRQEDRAFGVEHGRELAAALPNAELVLLPGAEHLPQQGDSQAVLDAVDVFLGDEPRPAVPVADKGSGLHVILFTDIEGSTTLTQRLGDAAARDLLRVHDMILRAALRRHGGTEIKHTGDGMMASFASATSAVECAVAMQRALAEENRAHPDTPVRVRMGLNAGEPVAEEQDLFGTAVQAAARIAAVAKPEQILLADVVRQLAAGVPFAFVHRGRVTLKGFPHRFRLFEVEWREDGRRRGRRRA